MTQPAIAVRDLQKSYGDVSVLRGVDFAVGAGSIYALLGANGAGKTTVVRILSTLLRADAGTALIAGYDVGADPERVRETISLTGQFAAVDEIHRLAAARGGAVAVAPLRQADDHREERGPLVGQAILVAHRVLLVDLATQDALVNEALEALGDDAA